LADCFCPLACRGEDVYGCCIAGILRRISGARAALATKGLDAGKHSGVISLFNQHFVKTGILPKDYGKILKNSKDLRQAGDYDDFYLVSREEALAALENASLFIRGIKLFLKIIREE